MILLWVGLGGALGSMARHGLNRLIHQHFLSAAFPLGTLVINISGSAGIGVLAGLLASGKLHLSYETRTFIVVGLFGGFTTFSSFSLDTLTLMRAGHPFQAGANVLAQVALSLFGVWAGFRVSGG